MSKIFNIAILGGGESGIGSALLAKKLGFGIWVSDFGKIKPNFLSELVENEIQFEEGGHDEVKILNADEIIKSPGIPDNAPIVLKAIEKGISVISEIEFAARHTKAKIIGITGTNGKTTTTLLTHHVLKSAGLKVGLAGNVGYSFARQVALEDNDYYVLEISSFQLDGIKDFKSDIAILTNITPDHLDRYDYKVENYIASKFRITLNQSDKNFFIYNIDDELTMNNIGLANSNSQQIPISIKQELPNGASAINNQININLKNNKFTMSTLDLSLHGLHNTYNSMAAAVVANILDIRKEVIRDSLSNFKNIEHRLEFVTKVRGVEFVNDSKATNVNSAWYALESMDKPVIWIAGGVDKGNDYSQLSELVRQKVRLIICMGTDNRKIHDAFKKDVDMIVNTFSAKEAVLAAYKFANPGEVVLLSPACASFDLFENYEDRGRKFKEAVKNL